MGGEAERWLGGGGSDAGSMVRGGWVGEKVWNKSGSRAMNS